MPPHVFPPFHTLAWSGDGRNAALSEFLVVASPEIHHQLSGRQQRALEKASMGLPVAIHQEPGK